MNAIAILGAINAGLALIESLLPLLQQAVQAGEITVDQQSELLAKYVSLKNRADGQFSGPEWKVE